MIRFRKLIGRIGSASCLGICIGATVGSLSIAQFVPRSLRKDGLKTPYTLTSQNVYWDADTLGGTLDGANPTFSLSAVPNPATSLLLFRNGMVMKQQLDYTLAANTVTFVPSAVPQPGDTLLASYRTGIITTFDTAVSQPLQFLTGGSERIRITGDGNVGVGTAAPNAAFEVSKASTDAAVEQEVLRVSTSGRSAAGGTTNRSALISFYDGANYTLTGALGGYRVNSNSDYNGGLRFYVNNTGGLNATAVTQLTESMRITNGGNVGIGTTIPRVSGNGKFHHAGNTIRVVDSARTPVATGEVCNFGEIALDSTYLYVCSAASSWKRIQLASF